MKRVWLLLVVVVLVSCACCAVAAPSFRGYTGLVKVPTANTLDAGEYSLGVMSEGADDLEASDLFAMLGVGGRAEIGVDSFQPLGASERKTLINAKYRFSDSRSGFAIGVIDAANEVEQTGYVVATKSLIRRTNIFASIVSSVRGHIGLGAGRLNGVFGGLSVYAGNRVAFSIEWDSKDVNLGFRLTPIRGLRLHAAILDAGNRDDIGLGMSYTRTY